MCSGRLGGVGRAPGVSMGGVWWVGRMWGFERWACFLCLGRTPSFC